MKTESFIKYPDLKKPFNQQDSDVLLAMAIYGEARGESFDTKLGVACVIKNRLRAGHYYYKPYCNTYRGVILKPYQFSAFNRNNPNRKKLYVNIGDIVYENCYLAGYLIKQNILGDRTGGAVFYFSKPLIIPPKAWGDVEHTKTIGGLSFWKPKQGG